MSRIGKTTILKATLNDIKYMYNGACFLKCIEDNGDCYTTFWNILEQFKV